MKRIVIFALIIGASAICFAQEQPQWVNQPYSYEAEATGVSQWFYDVGISSRAASERLARDRARDNIQISLAKNIASDIVARIDTTTFSLSMSEDDIVDESSIVETVITNTIRTKVPSYDPREWFVERGAENGKNYYVAYVLVRCQRNQIIAMIENINPETIVDNIIKQLKIRQNDIDREGRENLIKQLTEQRDRIRAAIFAGDDCSM
ncbi:MAG: hypothetical protein FWB77_02060 [Treponema sp.]|nr:hypothetical protein [Treponema sp.]